MFEQVSVCASLVCCIVKKHGQTNLILFTSENAPYFDLESKCNVFALMQIAQKIC